MRYKHLIVLILCLMLTNCYESKIPLSDTETSKIDKALLGVWKGKVEDGDVYFHFSRGGMNKINGLLVEHHSDQTMKVEAYDIFTTKIGDSHFLSSQQVGAKGSDEPFFILKYFIDGKKIKLWQFNDVKLKEAISVGLLKGEIQKGNFNIETIRLTDIDSRITSFIESSSDDLFEPFDAFDSFEKLSN